MFKIMAVNERTLEKMVLGYENDIEEAQWQVDNSIDLDENEWIVYIDEVYEDPDSDEDFFDPCMNDYDF